MHSDLRDSSSTGRCLEVMLDGLPVTLPPERRSLAAIRSYLETLALEQHRILCSFCVDGKPVDLGQPMTARKPFARVEGTTIDLAQMPLQLVETAMQQTACAREQVTATVGLVMINSGRAGRELWWNLARNLKHPLLTLSLMPEAICGPNNGGASLMQLRKWQLQQLASIIKDVDKTCWSDDPTALASSLEQRVLPWLDKLQGLLDLWHATLLIGRTAGL
jgi:hypothetical protein